MATDSVDSTSLYFNYFDEVQTQFFDYFDDNRKLGDKNWIAMWGKLHAGPFNTHCLAEAGAVAGYPNGNECTRNKDRQPLPPVPTQKPDIVVVKG